MISGFLLLIFLACVGILFKGGLWRNSLRLINVTMASIVALNFFEPVAGLLESNIGKSYTYFYDFVALWALFAVSLAVFRVLTEMACPVDVEFADKVDWIGGGAAAVLVGWAMVCFTLLSLHTAPLPRCFMGFQPEEPSVLGTAPDRAWLGVVQRLSQGSLATGASAEDIEAGRYGFDPDVFLLNYNVRRANLEDYARSRNRFLVQ